MIALWIIILIMIGLIWLGFKDLRSIIRKEVRDYLEELGIGKEKRTKDFEK